MPLLNLRDVATSAGTRPPLAEARLYRSGQPFDLTEQDVAPIEGTVDTIVDLRDLDEVQDGDWELMRAKGVRIEHIPLAGQVMAMSEHEAAGAASSSVVDSVEAAVAGAGDDPLGAFYVGMLNGSGDAIAEVARAVASSQGVLLHCAAGKDRTGIATALMLDLIGVGHEAIVGDYERTGEAMPGIIAQLAARYGFAGQAADGEAGASQPLAGIELNGIPKEFLQAPRAAIDTFLAALAQRGGARPYLQSVGLGSAELDALVAHLTQPRA